VFSRDAVVHGCTIVSNTSGSGGGLQTTGSSVIWNTILLFNAGSGTSSNFNADAGATYTGCCLAPLPGTGTGNLYADPLFVNRAGGNFRLARGSPCIDRNVAVGPATRDPDGVLRPQAGDGDGIALYDPGAYEYVLPRVVNDFEYDGKTDLAVCQTATLNWYVQYSRGIPALAGQNWGWNATRPVNNQYPLNRRFGLLP